MPPTAPRTIDIWAAVPAMSLLAPVVLVLGVLRYQVLAVLGELWYPMGTRADAGPALMGWAFAAVPALAAAAALLRDRPRAARWGLVAGLPFAAFAASVVLAGEGVDAEFSTGGAALFRLGAACGGLAYLAGPVLLGGAALAVPAARRRLAAWSGAARIVLFVAAAQLVALPAALVAAGR